MWHFATGKIKIPTGENDEWIEIDNGAEYGDSAMCERTVQALKHPRDWTMIWVIVALSLIILSMSFATLARADVMIKTRCQRFWNSNECVTTYKNLPPVADAIPLEEDLQTIEEVTRIWGLACRPKRIVGADGLSRWIYGRKDCDIGHINGEKLW
jgi:hypothetical protein